MDEFHQHILYLVSIPIYAIVIPLEIILSNLHHLGRYTTRETFVNVYMNALNFCVDLTLRGVALAVLLFFYQHHLSYQWPVAAYWVVLYLGEDFLFWLEHYIDHSCRLFWAVHVTHHSSQEYNLTTGFRSSIFMPFYRYNPLCD